MSDPVVLQLQADCLDASVPISTLVRKAKLIASKLGLSGTEDWLESELNGYKGALNDLPSYRQGIGQPKYSNPNHGWLDIVLTNQETLEMVSRAFLPQAIAELEHMVASEGDFVILGFIRPVNDFLHNTLGIEFNCGLCLSKTVLVGAIEGVKNTVLDWAIRLEEGGVLGEGLRFSRREIQKAQHVINHIYGSNIGVLGGVAGDSNVSDQTIQQSIDYEALLGFVAQVRCAEAALPAKAVKPLQEAISTLEDGAKSKDPSKVKGALSSMKAVLEGAAGNLAASGILAAIGNLGVA